MSETAGQPSPAGAPPTTRRDSRLAWLDALRGFAALCVVFDHASTLVLMPVRDYLYRWVNLGQFGVFVFFLVSGYIVPASLERRGSLRKFWIGRGFRLYPMFIAALLLTLIIYEAGYGTLGGAQHHPSSAIAGWLLMLQNLLPGYNVPNVTWTLSYEMLFYLLLAGLFSYGLHKRSATYALTWAVGAVALGGVLPMAVFAHWARTSGERALLVNLLVDALILGGVLLSVVARGTWAIRVGASIATLTVLVLATVDQTYPYAWSACTILALMFTGTVIYRAERGEASRVVAALVVAAVLALTVFAGLWHGHKLHEGRAWDRQWLTSIVLAFAVFGIGFAVRHLRVPRWCAWLGLISYSVYLLHPLVLNAYRDARGSVPFFRHSHSIGVQVLIFAGLLAVIVALSAVTYYLIEKPMQGLGRRVAARPGPAVPASPVPASPVAYATVADAPVVAADGTVAGSPVTGADGDGPPMADGTPAPDGTAAARSASSSSAVAGGSGASP
jgi:peptidoglycan/LPS O-acetylase OafA/YrhL